MACMFPIPFPFNLHRLQVDKNSYQNALCSLSCLDCRSDIWKASWRCPAKSTLQVITHISLQTLYEYGKKSLDRP